MIHPGMTGRVHLCQGNVDRTGPGVICQSPSRPRGATDWSTAGGQTNPFIGTRAWLIKQVPLGQKAAGVGSLHVPVSARLAGRHTPPHKGGGNATVFFQRRNVQNTRNTREDVTVSDLEIASLSRGVGCAYFRLTHIRV